jgi:RimK family alpha-L-glutamate ligase/uncharacterized protein (TIGR02118 family)
LSLDDAKKGMATPGFKKVGDDLAIFATGGLIGMVAVETGDKGTAACPALLTVIYNTPTDSAAFESYYSATHLPLVGGGQQEIGFVRADLTRFDSNLDGSAPAKYRQAELCFNSMDDLRRASPLRRSRRSVTISATSRPAASPPSSASSSSLHLVILAAREGWHTRELTRALDARGHTGTIVPYEGLVASIGHRPGLRSGAADLDRADAVLARIIPSGSLEQIVFRMDALHRLEDRGVRVMNSPRAIERTLDKSWTSALLEQCGLPTPDTIVCESVEEAFAGFRTLGDVIVKPLFGSMGLGMVRVSDEEMAFRVFKTIEQIRGVYYLQRTIEHEGRDIRAFVVGGRVLAAIERRSEGWRTNLSRGGTARPVQLSEAWSALAVRAAAAVGAEYAGVDLLPARDGTVYVLEVNGIPGWQGLQEATGVDVAGALVEQLAGRAR